MSAADTDIDCTLVRDAIRDGTRDDADVQAHAASCPGCRELLDADGLAAALAEMPDASLSPELLVRITGVVSKEPAPRPRGGRTAALLGVLVLGGAVLGLGARRPDLGELAVGPLVALGVTLAVGAALGAWTAARPPWRPALSPAVTWGGVLALLLLPAVALGLPLGAPMGVAALSGATAACFGYGAMMVVVGVGMLGGLFRRDTLLGDRWPLAAASGAAAGNLALLLHCPSGDPGHVLVGHVGLGVVAVLVALLVAATRPVSTRA